MKASETLREIAGEYAANGTIRIGDLDDRIATINGPIESVIRNGASGVIRYYQAIPNAIEEITRACLLLSDHSQYSDKLLEFSIQNDRRFRTLDATLTF